MIGEILQARLHAPIVFAGDEDKAGRPSRIWPASFFQARLARCLSDIPCTFRSSIGSPTALGRRSARTSSPAAGASPRPRNCAEAECPSGRSGYEP